MVAMATPGYWFPVNRTDSANNMFLKAQKPLLGHSAEGSNGHMEDPYMGTASHKDCDGVQKL